MKELYIDFDGVIMDTIPLLYDAATKAGVSRGDTEFYAGFDFASILIEENILNDSINCIKKLIESNKFVISVLTHINSLDEGVKKTLFLRNYFDDITVILVPKSISKTKMVHTKGAILVDDFYGNLEEWESEGGLGIRFSSDNVNKGFRNIDRLNILLDLF